MISWEKAPKKLVRRSAFIEIYGDTGTGRTTLALTAPGPIAFIHASEKIEGVVQKFASEKEIRMLDFGGEYRGTPEQIAKAASKNWDLLLEAWYDAFSWARSIILDTHTEAWELLRLSKFGAVKPSRGRVDRNYGPVNAEWRGMLKHFRHQDKSNIILIGQTKDEYKVKKDGTSDGMGQRTGRTIRAGQREVPFMTDVIIRTLRGEKGDFQSRIEKGWWNAILEGFVSENDMSTLPVIMEMITERDWE